ncbi:hypothetical protein P691DRAFT_681502 [Macrolepiota fuliginosa MF-IS2]|uniref:Reverse transcriptase/retrotransposon-derived protein RNase H-like domain-containing protein n=1 Tax=Macrolepiota fuliginosa MF-IS2 TaxID=1400762 RepID=A0A9P6BWY2_9AGAR|nr:hypothetical protein P691DRAFT_681502 [Macrolepiota fuliginosa MF-IS2]
MGHLHVLASSTNSFQWDQTAQQAFKEVKAKALAFRDEYIVPLDYTPGVGAINLVTDGCATGIGGVVNQGNEWQKAWVAAFFSAKPSTTQQKYPVHKIKMLAGMETMMRY